MLRILPLILLLHLSAQAAFSQDCSTLSVTASIISNYNGQQVSCTGAGDGIIHVTATGGTGTYVYTFENMPANTSGITTGTFTNIPAGGPYTFNVRDDNNCSAITASLIVVEPPLVVGTATRTSDYNGYGISCFGNSNGEITGIANGGAGSYTYQLIGQTQNTSGLLTGVFTNVSAGTYTVKVSDVNNCQSFSTPIVVTQPAQLNVGAMAASDYNGAQISCAGEADGKITALAQGGVVSYLYRLPGSPDQASNSSITFDNLEAGDHTVTAIDANGCVATSLMALTEPDEITIESTITASHGDDGSVELTVQGGTNPYTFLWSDESTAQNLMNVNSGEYSVEIKDQNNCSLTKNFTVPLVVGLPEKMEEHIRVVYDQATAEPYLSCSTSKSGKISIRLHDLKGVTSYSLDTQQEAGVSSYKLSSQLTSGLYIAQVRINQTIHSIKFIVF